MHTFMMYLCTAFFDLLICIGIRGIFYYTREEQDSMLKWKAALAVNAVLLGICLLRIVLSLLGAGIGMPGMIIGLCLRYIFYVSLGYILVCAAVLVLCRLRQNSSEKPE